MDIKSKDLLPNLIIAFPLVASAVVLFILGQKRMNRFFFFDYQGNSKERFKDNLISSIFHALVVACVVPVILLLSGEKINWGILPISLCLGALAIPIGILGAYWRSYQTNKLWGGFMPLVRAKYGYTNPQSIKQNKIDPSKIKLPRRIGIIAGLVAILVFCGTFVIFYQFFWKGSEISGIFIGVVLSAITGFGVFMTIVTAVLSQRIQKLRDGEILDDEDDV